VFDPDRGTPKPLVAPIRRKRSAGKSTGPHLLRERYGPLPTGASRGSGDLRLCDNPAVDFTIPTGGLCHDRVQEDHRVHRVDYAAPNLRTLSSTPSMVPRSGLRLRSHRSPKSHIEEMNDGDPGALWAINLEPPATTLAAWGFQAACRQHRPVVERAIAWLTRGNRKRRYRCVANNDLWLHHPIAALNLRRLLALGLTRRNGVWVLA